MGGRGRCGDETGDALVWGDPSVLRDSPLRPRVSFVKFVWASDYEKIGTL